MNKRSEEYDTGMGTSTMMWEMLSEILTEQKEELPRPLNEAIYALRDGRAAVVAKHCEKENAGQLDPLAAGD